MVALPPRPEQQIVDAIYRTYEAARAKEVEELRLSRLGASSIGEECLRKVWLDWRAFDVVKFEGRMLRLFDTGHHQEARIVADLAAAGLTVWDKNLKTKRQYEFVDKSGHFVCKADGIVKGVPGAEKTPHLLEVKTHNKDSFASLEKKGVRAAKPEHYAQMQTGMRVGKLTRALYVALCKDNEKYYIERVYADKAVQDELDKKIATLRAARLRPAGVADNPDSFLCKWCDFTSVCYKKTAPLVNCRTCEHAVPIEDGQWYCELLNTPRTLDEQRAACSEHRPL